MEFMTCTAPKMFVLSLRGQAFVLSLAFVLSPAANRGLRIHDAGAAELGLSTSQGGLGLKGKLGWRSVLVASFTTLTGAGRESSCFCSTCECR